ncbi:MAG: adenine methyltransferase [Gammaproteobacteria bacterium HGW-Gammaproteobacteria-1]|nr:MAG: adenine methyltransferase [Gammaproteobacteria bacterium HGW-Gammaproteobacteria-1]
MAVSVSTGAALFAGSPRSRACVARPAHEVRPPLVSPLKWAGGKRRLVEPYLRPLWQGHEHRVLVEPFVGAMSVALGLRPERALLNDVNPHVVNFLRELKRGLKITIPLLYDHDYYYAARERFNDLIARGEFRGSEAAQLFYLLNRTGFNGLCRFSGRTPQRFNVPFGRHKTVNFQEDFARYRAAMKGWRLSNRDFEHLEVGEDAFVYADPPYDGAFTAYSGQSFDWDDQVRLAEWLASRRCPVVASNHATLRIKRLYRKLGFRIREISVARSISCTGGREAAREIIAVKGFGR